MCKQLFSELIPGRCTPPVLTSPIHFRYVTNGSLSFVPEPKPFGFTSFIGYAQFT